MERIPETTKISTDSTYDSANRFLEEHRFDKYTELIIENLRDGNFDHTF